MSLVVKPSARERFTPRELIAAYEDFLGSEPQYLDAETGIKATAYLFGAGVLLVYEEPETHVVVLIHPTSQNKDSANSTLMQFLKVL
jgi:hypothetical protein